MNQNYGRLIPTPSARITELESTTTPKPPSKTRTCQILLLLAGALLIIATACGIPVAMKSMRRAPAGSSPGPGTTRVIRKACGMTRFPEICQSTLAKFPGAVFAKDPLQVAHISVNMTLQKFGVALGESTEIRNWEMDTWMRSAYEDCLELLDDSVDLLGRSLLYVSQTTSSSVEVESGSDSNGDKVQQGGSQQDVMTWLSGAMTNHDTCTEGFNNVGGTIKNQMLQRLQDLSELVSNSLAIYAASHNMDDFSGTPIQNRRLLGFEPETYLDNDSGFPKWMTRSERELLGTPTQSVQADIVVAQDGSGTVKTITEAIKKAPENSARRIIILVKAGTYAEDNLKVGRKKTNLWFLGEGKGRTVISGQRSVGRDQITTFHTAAFAASGTGFVVRDITFVNEAGPGNHQAVALRVGADHAVVYRCEIKGYQDTLYVHSQRQFYRECDIYGTVDFIFGNAAVVFQNCTMWARKPMPQQKVTITAQNRKDPNQNTGMSIQACQARATTDLEAAKSSYPTYLGRPWKIFARVVYMESYLGDHIDPRGWLEWNATSPLDKLYYGEYGNVGPRADTSQRVKWPGLHVNMARGEAEKFTVSQFIFGQDWITSTGVSYQSGLSA
ncbi:probable pectinesterase/pectinesterase inhibitor 61 isoform X1 [Chenopodium quinoa]|uniref:probable pectinesterase/pectinesterase inhibitor 61 isoform X1 n=1 Tax=Chenopodium quinoa TaxID=63459 RepID=UPI000B776A90|nr:probable pectinesterase/pectinesterase inhibitor 61 isoform X1 [Chenopodium quinoa]